MRKDIVESSYVDVDIFRLIVNDIYEGDSYRDTQFVLSTIVNQFDYEELPTVYSVLNALGYDVSSPNEFIESLISFVFIYHDAMLVASKFSRLTQENDNDDLYR